MSKPNSNNPATEQQKRFGQSQLQVVGRAIDPQLRRVTFKAPSSPEKQAFEEVKIIEGKEKIPSVAELISEIEKLEPQKMREYKDYVKIQTSSETNIRVAGKKDVVYFLDKRDGGIWMKEIGNNSLTRVSPNAAGQKSRALDQKFAREVIRDEIKKYKEKAELKKFLSTASFLNRRDDTLDSKTDLTNKKVPMDRGAKKFLPLVEFTLDVAPPPIHNIKTPETTPSRNVKTPNEEVATNSWSTKVAPKPALTASLTKLEQPSSSPKTPIATSLSIQGIKITPEQRPKSSLVTKLLRGVSHFVSGIYVTGSQNIASTILTKAKTEALGADIYQSVKSAMVFQGSRAEIEENYEKFAKVLTAISQSEKTGKAVDKGGIEVLKEIDPKLDFANFAKKFQEQFKSRNGKKLSSYDTEDIDKAFEVKAKPREICVSL